MCRLVLQNTKPMPQKQLKFIRTKLQEHLQIFGPFELSFACYLRLNLSFILFLNTSVSSEPSHLLIGSIKT